MTTTNNEFRIGVAGVLFASLVWGTTGTAAAFAPDVSAAAIGAAAMGIGGLLQAAIALKSIGRAAAELKRFWLLLVVGGVAVAIYPLAFYGSMRLAGVTIGTVVTIGSAPLLSALIEKVFDGAQLSKRWLVGALIGLVGMVLLCVAEGSHTDTILTGNATILGIALGLLGGLTYALYSFTARGLMLRGIRSRAAMGATFGVGGLLLMPVLFMTGGPFLASWNNAAVGIYMASVPMFLGYIAFGMGLARIPASMATTITLLEPVVAAMLAVIILGERLPALGWLGVVLIIFCLVVITAPIRFRVPGMRASAERV
ncbi:EamA family transporter [Rhizobiales bacterium RZME27]|uniref:EamA family transporter n=1 Tax=Endobacterium cereale TaxID=2663029 RepID=A0A6A8A8N3_9HYPH|nr:EamA family transporter [Endobacterium cereale]MEB2846957.1 EamA family transporter [Endobacterium cereale]MQY47625.1 EamA family transporter [Endobacterium cereale]